MKIKSLVMGEGSFEILLITRDYVETVKLLALLTNRLCLFQPSFVFLSTGCASPTRQGVQMRGMIFKLKHNTL